MDRERPDWWLVSRRAMHGLTLLVVLHVQPTLAQSGTTTRASVDSAGQQANASSWSCSISADGRCAAFDSNASNLVPGDTNGVGDVFVHDRQMGHTSRVSVDSAGNQGMGISSRPSISSDGRCVAFSSWADNLVAGDTNETTDVFVHDRQTGHTTRVSVDSAGNEGNSSSWDCSISEDGGCVAFKSHASDLVPGDTNGAYDVFVHDRRSGRTTRVSVDSAGNQADSYSLEPSISSGGRRVAFASFATNLVPGDTNGGIDVFVHDRQRGLTTRVSVDSIGNQGNARSIEPSISWDGRHVAFNSEADNLVLGDANGNRDIFVHDCRTRRTTRVSVDSAGKEGNGWSTIPTISSTGRWVAFSSFAKNLVPGDTNGKQDIFVRDRETGQTSRVSVDSAGNQANDWSVAASISGDGRCVAFNSDASNLVGGDTNEDCDVFVRDRQDCAGSAAIYCTAKTTSSGCTPAIGSSGVASATAPSGFRVSASQVEPDRVGILFYGSTGPEAAPFQGGLLCVRPPLRRTPPQSSGSAGPPPCTGILTLDLNAAGICAEIGVGYRGWMQGWFQDPASPGATGLTDALEWTVCP